MRNSLKPGGIMTMIVWRYFEEGPWLYIPKQVVLGFLPPPGENARTCGPGKKQLEIAGYTEIDFERIDAPLLIDHTPEETIEMQVALGPAGEVYREAGELVIQSHDKIAAA